MNGKIDNLQWCEVTKVEVKGHNLCIKDAMILLDEDELIPDWPYVNSSPGNYVFEIFIRPKRFMLIKPDCEKSVVNQLLDNWWGKLMWIMDS